MHRTLDPRPMVRGFSVVILVLVAGCSRLTSTTDSHVLGHLSPRSGPDQASGLRCSEAVAMMVEEFNVDEKNRIEQKAASFIHGDTGSEPDGFGFQAMRLLTVNRALALVGGTRAAQLDKLSPVVIDGQVILVTAAGGPPPAGNRLTFCVGLDPRERGRYLARFAAQERQIADVTLMVDASHPFFTALADSFTTEFQHPDRRVRQTATYRTRPELIELAARLGKDKPTALVMCGQPADLVLVRQTVSDVPTFFGGEEVEASLVQDPSRVEGVYFTSAITTAHGATNSILEFANKLGKRSRQTTMDAEAALSADAARILLTSGKKAGSFKQDKLRGELSKYDADCVTGPFWFTPEQTARRTVFVLQVRNGRAELAKSYAPEKK